MTRQPARLYGLPHAERLSDDPAGVWESEVEPNLDPDNLGPWTVEEWTVRPPLSTTPSTHLLLEWITEHVDDELGLEEPSIPKLEDDAQVKATADYLLALIASRASYFAADELVATHVLEVANTEALADPSATLDPLLDGEPLYGPRAGNPITT